MNKRKLKRLIDESINNVNKFRNYRTYHRVLSAKVVNVDLNDILVAEVYEMNRRYLEFIIFFDKTTKEFFTYKVCERMWSEACIINLISDMAKVQYLNQEDRIIASKYFENETKESIYAMSEFQLNIRSWELRERHKRSRQFIDDTMNQVGALPNDIDTFIREKALKYSRYMYYRKMGTSKKSSISGYCSYCKKSVEIYCLSGKLQNTKVKCPACKSEVILKPIGRACDIVDFKFLTIVEKIPAGIIARDFEVAIYHNKDYHKNPQIVYKEQGRRLIDKNKVHFFIYEQRGAWNNKRWDWFIPKYQFGYYSVIYTHNLKTVFKDTEYKYCCADLYTKKVEELDIMGYLRAYKDKPIIEYLLKLKLYNLCKDVVNGKFFYNSSNKGIKGALGIDKHDLATIQKLDLNYKELSFWKWCRESKNIIKPEYIKIIRKMSDKSSLDYERFKEVSNYTTFSKFLTYIQKQIRKINKQQNINLLLLDWMDYIRFAKELNYDIQSESILFPQDLKIAHDRASDIVKTIKDKNTNKAIKNIYNENIKKYSFKGKKFFITLPKSANEIIKEGEKLRHCVGTYTTKVAKGECLILLLRDVNKPKTPFYTIEVRKGKVAQIRGFGNCDEIPEVEKFMKQYENKVLKPIEIENQEENKKQILENERVAV